MKKVVLFVGILIIVSVGFTLFVMQKEPSDTEQPGEQETKEIDFLTLLKDNENTQQTSLRAVDGSNSSGTAYRLWADGALLHAVVAFMPDPGINNAYEGWLVQLGASQFFSTGVMEKNDKGEWVLEYTAQEEFSNFLRVVITKETVVDAIPELHILEGDF